MNSKERFFIHCVLFAGVSLAPMAVAQAPQSQAEDLRRGELNAYIRRAELELDQKGTGGGFSKFSAQLTQLAVELGDMQAIKAIFARCMNECDDNERMLAAADYAGALARTGDPAADEYYRKAVEPADPANYPQFYMQYAKYLMDQKRPSDALPVLERVDPTMRQNFPLLMTLRISALRMLGLDDVQALKELQESPYGRGGPGVGGMVIRRPPPQTP